MWQFSKPCDDLNNIQNIFSRGTWSWDVDTDYTCMPHHCLYAEATSNTRLIWALVLIYSSSTVAIATDHLALSEETIWFVIKQIMCIYGHGNNENEYPIHYLLLGSLRENYATLNRLKIPMMWLLEEQCNITNMHVYIYIYIYIYMNYGLYQHPFYKMYIPHRFSYVHFDFFCRFSFKQWPLIYSLHTALKSW